MSNRSAIDILQDQVRGRVELNASMARLTTMGTGGLADILIHPADREDLSEVLSFLTEREINYRFLGNGSGVVARDGGIQGAVVNLTEGFSAIERLPDEEGRPAFRAEAGLPLETLVEWTAAEGIGGFAFLDGIPGTVGGALVLNAGSWGEEIGDRVTAVETMSNEGETVVSDADTMGFAYRCCRLPKGRALLSASFLGVPGETEAIRARVAENRQRRIAEQPMETATAGMIFRNPEGQHAGEIIDECGLKGVRVGGAIVSEQHANFILNLGSASASQVVSLVGLIQERVYVKNKLNLQTKVEFIGSWQKDKLRIQE